jgi:hypothetical protein
MSDPCTLHPPLKERSAGIVSVCNIEVKSYASGAPGSLAERHTGVHIAPVAAAWRIIRLALLTAAVSGVSGCAGAGDTQIHSVLRDAGWLANRTIYVSGVLIDITPVPWTSLVIGTLTDGSDTVHVLAPVDALVAVGQRIRLRGRIYRAGVPGIISITVGPVLIVTDSVQGGVP